MGSASTGGLAPGSIHDEVKVVAPVRYVLEDLSFPKLPDRNTITSALDVEVLFQRSVIGKEATSFQISRKCDFATRKELYTSVVSSGGTTMFKVFLEERTTKEPTALAPSTMRLRRLLRFGMDWRSVLSSLNTLPLFRFF